MKTNRKIITLVSLALFGGFLATLRDPQNFMIIIGLLLALLPLVFIKQSRRDRIRFLVLGIALALFELIAIKTGLPYGEFSYSFLMEPLLLGLPVTMMVIWPTILLGVLYVGQKIANRHRIKATCVASLIALVLLVGYDLVMDPGAVAMGLWQFGEIGNFYNVPLSNFIGWGVFGLVGLSLIKFFKIDIDEGYLVSLMALLGFWTTYTLFIGLYIPAVLGAILLLLFVTTTDWVEAKFIK